MEIVRFMKNSSSGIAIMLRKQRNGVVSAGGYWVKEKSFVQAVIIWACYRLMSKLHQNYKIKEDVLHEDIIN